MITVKEYLDEYNKSKDIRSSDLIKEYNKSLIEKYPWLIPTNAFTGVKITTKEPGYYGGCDDIPEYDYEFTELDQMPDGWRLAFGEQMCEEIHQELVKFNFVDEYRILQIKEKFGGLRWYDSGTPIGDRELYGELHILPNNTLPEVGDNEYYDYVKTLDDGTKVYNHYVIYNKCKIHDIIDKYENMSYSICVNCGKPAKWISRGWICPYCDDCKKDIESKRPVLFDDIDEKYN